MLLQPLAPGDPARVGPHRLLARLGQGGMGTVYLALSPEERVVAVKVLRDGPSDAEGRRRFRRELDVLQRVRGPHLVEVLGGDADAATPWLVTRFVPGRRLDDAVAEGGPLSEAGLLRVALGIAQGLRALHAAGVVHRDLTPGNVLLVDGEPHVIDLGLAVVADVTALTRSGLVVGTAGYLAPEQVLGHPCGPAADVHAWGATLALAATGRPPYGTGRPEAVLYRVVHSEPDLEGVPAAIAPLVAAALAKDPAARPLDDQLVAELTGLSARARHLVGASSGPHRVLPPSDQPMRPDDVDAVLGRDATAVLGREVTELLLRGAGTADLGAGDLFSRQDTTVLRLPDAPVPGSDDTRVLRLPDVPTPGRDDTRVLPVHPVSPVAERPPPPSTPPAEPTPVARPSRVQPWVIGVPAAASIAAAGLLAPIVVAVAATAGLVLLQAGVHAGDHRRRLVEQRGPRRRDSLLAVLGLPVRLLTSAFDLACGLPLLVVGAGLPAYAVQTSVGGDDGVTAGAATAVLLGVLLTLVRTPYADARSALVRGSRVVAVSAADAFLAGAVLLVATVVLAGAAKAGPHWWPASAPPVTCVPLLRC